MWDYLKLDVLGAAESGFIGYEIEIVGVNAMQSEILIHYLESHSLLSPL